MRLLNEVYGIDEVEVPGNVHGYFLVNEVYSDYDNFFVIAKNPDEALDKVTEAASDKSHASDQEHADVLMNKDNWMIYQLPDGAVYLGNDTKTFDEMKLKEV